MSQTEAAPLRRRTLLPLLATGLAAPVLLARSASAASTGASSGASPAATAAQTAAWESPRTLGSPSAKVVVNEWFSLTCTHCAHFSQTTFPEARKKLIETGKVRWVFRDFPLDKVALQAAQVARALPPDRYTAFVLALFADQDRWAFASGVNYAKALWQMAALAGMDRPTFDAAVGDTSLRTWILTQQDMAEKKWKIDATPSFVINGRMIAGEMSYDEFLKQLPSVT
ncbi:MAG: DsbA family protein [Rhodospirillales bacterium]|jgi:protein-disulfide isomerase|nr:DsbA family protein [Rhodospirillales bacterium]